MPGALHAAISYVPLYGASPLWFRAIVFSANVGAWATALSLLKYASGDLDTSYDGNTKLTHNSRNWWAHAVADLAGFIFFVPWTLAWMPRSITGVLRKGGIV